MLAIAIAGPRKSGKTTLLSLLAEELERRGKTVAAIKYSNHPLEQENTDAFWLRRLGRTIVNVAPEETVLFWSEALSFERITALLDADVLLLEGGGAPADISRILCLPEDAEEAIACIAQHGDFTVIASVGGSVPAEGVPHFQEAEPVAAEKLATLILERGTTL